MAGAMARGILATRDISRVPNMAAMQVAAMRLAFRFAMH